MLNQQTITTALRAVNSGATPSELLRVIGNEISDDWKLRSLHIYAFNHEGNLHVQGMYGVNPTLVESVASVATRDAMPASDAVRNEQTLIFRDRAEIQAAYESADRWPYIPDALACLPLFRGNTVIGVLALDFRRPLSEIGRDLVANEPDLLFLAELATLSLRPLHNGHQFVANQAGHVANHNGKPNHEMLSERHAEVLKLLCEGKTNRQIAKQLHLAESTVRYELSRLYSRLGVDTRQEAAAIAHIYLPSAS